MLRTQQGPSVAWVRSTLVWPRPQLGSRKDRDSHGIPDMLADHCSMETVPTQLSLCYALQREGVRTIAASGTVAAQDGHVAGLH